MARSGAAADYATDSYGRLRPGVRPATNNRDTPCYSGDYAVAASSRGRSGFPVGAAGNDTAASDAWRVLTVGVEAQDNASDEVLAFHFRGKGAAVDDWLV